MMSEGRTFCVLLLVTLLGTIPCSGYHESGGRPGEGFLREALKIHMCTDLGVCPITGVPVIRKFVRQAGSRRSARIVIRRPQRQAAVWEIPFEAFVYGFSPEKITVKQGDHVKLLITSRDEPHCISIEEFGVRASVQKGTTVVAEFTADRTGEFVVKCSLACRNLHAGSTARLVVEE